MRASAAATASTATASATTTASTATATSWHTAAVTAMPTTSITEHIFLLINLINFI